MWLFVMLLLTMVGCATVLVANVLIADKLRTLDSVVQELVLSYRQEAVHRHRLALAHANKHPENEEASALIVEAQRQIDLGDRLVTEGEAATALPFYRSTFPLIERMENQLKCGEPSCGIE
ncbi:MAG: hypothetical protein U0103_24465 [Candidatus Obscuribacterales bacterium]